MALTIEQGSVVHLRVDAIVNAANEQLMNSGGVASAIAKAAGPELDKACRRVAPCPTGDVRVTPGFGLKARFVIHAVGPIWHGGGSGEEDLLRRCYQRIIEEAIRADVRSLGAVPLSIGIFGYPLDAGCRIAVEELSSAPPAMQVRLMAFKDHEYAALQKHAAATAASASASASTTTLRFYDRDQPYYEFTNFYRRPIELHGSTWPTSEHYYQAQKFTDPALRERVRAAATPRDAQLLGGQLKPVRPGFHQARLDVMRTVLQAKFTQHDDLREKLLATGDAVLIEASPIDDFWGE